LTVFGYGLDTKDGFQVVGLDTVLHPLLKGKKRGVLEKHHGKSAHQAIMQNMVDFTALSVIIDLAEVLGERFSKSTEAEMFFVMH